jgi:uncharacterized integral membrane protein (TIGR00698 family)
MKVWLGYLLLVALALTAYWVSSLIVVGGREPVEASALAVLFGILLRNAWRIPAPCVTGVKAAEKLLVLGIVLMGFSLNYHKVLGEGRVLLSIIIVTMALGFIATLLLSRGAGLSEGLGILLSVGTCICGGTAVAITAPLIKAKEEETSYAVAVIALWGVAAIFIYPTIARQLPISDQEFGVFAGTAIHSTPQVVGAAFVYSKEAGDTATAVKLVRNCFMAPLALLIALGHTRKYAASAGGSPKVNYARAFPWFLFAYFIASWLGTEGYVTKEWLTLGDHHLGINEFTAAGRFLIVLGMAGVGLNTDHGSIRRDGLRPLFIGLAGAVVVAGVSAGMIGWNLR